MVVTAVSDEEKPSPENGKRTKRLRLFAHHSLAHNAAAAIMVATTAVALVCVAAFAAASAWWRTLPRRWMRWTGLVLAVCMGLSRLYVGVHYPSDVIAGALVGLFCGWAAWKLLQLWEERRGSRLR